MSDDTPPLVKIEGEAAAERSLVDDVRAVIDDGRTLIEAEIAYQKSRAALAGDGAKSVAGWGLLALSLVFVALMALVLAAVLGVALWISPLAALIGVPLALLALAGLSGAMAAQHWRRTAKQLSATEPSE